MREVYFSLCVLNLQSKCYLFAYFVVCSPQRQQNKSFDQKKKSIDDLSITNQTDQNGWRDPRWGTEKKRGKRGII